MPIEHGPWEDYKPSTVEHGPWEDYAPQAKAAVDAPQEKSNFLSSGIFAPETFGKLNYIQTEQARRMPGTPNVNEAIAEYEKRSKIAQAAGNREEAYANQARADVLRSDIESASKVTAPLALGTNLALSGFGAVKAIPKLAKAALTAIPSAWFGMEGAKQAVIPKQPGETASEYALRVGSGAGQAMLGAAGTVYGTADSLRSTPAKAGKPAPLRDLDVAHEHAGLGGKIFAQEHLNLLEKEVSKHVDPLIEAVNARHPEGSVSKDKTVDALFTAINKYFPTETRAGFDFPNSVRLIVKELKDAPGAMLTFDQAKSLRSAVGKALAKIHDPASKAPLSAAYGNLTEQMRAAAKEAGMEGSFNQYNAVTRKLYSPGGVALQDAASAKSGTEALKALHGERGPVKVLLNEMKPYGANPENIYSLIEAYKPTASPEAQKSLIDHWWARHAAGIATSLMGMGHLPGYGGVTAIQAVRSPGKTGAAIPPEAIQLGEKSAALNALPPPLEVPTPNPIPAASAEAKSTAPAVETFKQRMARMTAEEDARRASQPSEPRPAEPVAELPESIPAEPIAESPLKSALKIRANASKVLAYLKNPEKFSENAETQAIRFIQDQLGIDISQGEKLFEAEQGLMSLSKGKIKGKFVPTGQITQESAPVPPPADSPPAGNVALPPTPEPRTISEAPTMPIPERPAPLPAVAAPKVAPEFANLEAETHKAWLEKARAQGGIPAKSETPESALEKGAVSSISQSNLRPTKITSANKYKEQEKLEKWLWDKGIPFKSSHGYIRISLPDEKLARDPNGLVYDREFEIRVADHAQPKFGGYSEAKGERLGKSDMSLDPTTEKTVKDAADEITRSLQGLKYDRKSTNWVEELPAKKKE